MKRRNFVKYGSMSAVGILTLPDIMKLSGKVFGHHNKQYKIDTKWCQAIFGKNPVKNCHEMVEDQSGRLILLTDETKNNVLIFNKDGLVVDSWGTEYPGAHGLTIFDENGQEVLFITDTKRHQVYKTDLKGNVLMTLHYPVETGKYASESEYKPTETAIASNGDIYVVDGYGLDYIIQYNHKGEYIRHFGGRGEGSRFLNNAHGICIDNRNGTPQLIVSSRKEHKFNTYTLKGDYRYSINLPNAWVCRPVIHGEYLYAAVLQSEGQKEFPSGFVTILNADNQNISNVGGTAPLIDGSLELNQVQKIFEYPHDVCLDRYENIYVPQWNSHNVYPYRFTPV